MRHLGRPLANAALVAGFAAMTRRLTLPSVLNAISEKFPGQTGEANRSIAKEAYQNVLGSSSQPQESLSC